MFDTSALTAGLSDDTDSDVAVEQISNNIKERRKRMKITFHANSQLPYRLTRRRDEVALGSFETAEAATQALLSISEDRFNPTITRNGRVVAKGKCAK